MKKIVCFGLCFMIVLSSFVLCFASGSPVILPNGGQNNSGALKIEFGGGQVRWYNTNSIYPVYLVFANVNGSPTFLAFSDHSSTVVRAFNTPDNYYTYNLSNEYNGYYYVNNSFQFDFSDSPYYYDGDFSSIQSLIDDINNSVFSTSFDLSYLINGSVSWLSSMAQAAKNNGLLLFLVTVSLVGVGIGLFNRFRR